MIIKNKKILIVTSRFYIEISASLEKECIETINSNGFGHDIIDMTAGTSKAPGTSIIS